MDFSITLRMDTCFDELKSNTDDSVPLWERIARKKRSIRNQAIPQEWRLQPGQIPDTQLNAMDVPSQCGILTTREIKITGMSASTLVDKIVNREHTSYEVNLRFSQSHVVILLTLIQRQVTLAFCKRAAISQQLVCASKYPSSLNFLLSRENRSTVLRKSSSRRL